jgi:hypothetical protein
MSALTVSGGAGGMAAHLDDLLGMAALLRTTSGCVDDAIADLTAPVLLWLLADGGDTDPFAVPEVRQCLDTLAGPGGLLPSLQDRLAGIGLSLTTAVASYQRAERGVQTSFATDAADAIWSAMRLVPVTAFGTGPSTDDLAALYNLPRVLAPFIADGSPALHDLGPDESADGVLPPRNLADLVVGLSARDRGEPGEISVSFVHGTDGRRRAIVDIPGTKSWNPEPVGDVTSVGTDILAISGRTTSYEKGVFAALHDAGVDGDTDVMLVGHSEGGIVAVDAARDAALSGQFRITHVVTAGSPVGRLARSLPERVSLLSLENGADVVPDLDGVANPDRRNVTTVRVHDERGSVGANHNLDGVYLPEAAAADAAHDRSVDAFVRGADGFLGASTMTTHAYQVTRTLG